MLPSTAVLTRTRRTLLCLVVFLVERGPQVARVDEQPTRGALLAARLGEGLRERQSVDGQVTFLSPVVLTMSVVALVMLIVSASTI